ncbi:hypothetical protein DyAD56_15190 [Dyella sp. AD56]|nr:hypothetical protein DyAD56_15190 [Dyella sp. AD56]
MFPMKAAPDPVGATLMPIRDDGDVAKRGDVPVLIAAVSVPLSSRGGYDAVGLM